MRAAFKLLCALTLILLWTVVPAVADVPTEMSVQGRLTNGAGAPVPAGFKNFTFKIFDQQVGGVEIWPGGPGETQLLSTDANGLWNAGVGEIIPLTEAVFLSPVRWLEVTVNDGVNPIETLPRIELRTNPYTYRAATSQQADSLAGNSLSDLGDLWVDEVGDTMSGPLANYYTQKDLGTSVQVHNYNDAWFGGWNDFIGTWGITGQVGGDNSNWNVGIAGSAEGNNNTSDANYGILGYANGSGVTNVGIHGRTGLSGTTNYSGLFTSGDFAVFGTQTSGSGGVLLPTDAIDNTEILDEPGIAYDNTLLVFSISAHSNTGVDIARVTITTPAAGYVVVTGSVGMLFSGTTGINYGWINLDTSGTDNSLFNSTWYWGGANAHASTGNEYGMVTATRVFNLPAGSHTFEIIGNGYTSNNALASVGVNTANILATYQPTGYGGVDALVADASGFEHSNSVRQSIGEPLTGQATFYEVDLRELELRAARTQLEAEKAKRALLEAQTGALLMSNKGVVKEGANR